MITLFSKKSQNHRIMADVGRDFWRSSGSTASAQAGSPEPCPDGFLVSPRMKMTPQPLLATCADGQSHSQKNVS